MDRPKGYHLMLDGISDNIQLLQDGKKLEKVLDEIVTLIGMTKIAGPFVRLYIPKEEYRHKEWGYSGIVVIAESHISVHTYPDFHYVSIDVYSCKQFDRREVEDVLTRKFRIVKKDVRCFLRGL